MSTPSELAEALDTIRELRRAKKADEARKHIETLCAAIPKDADPLERAKALLVRADMRSHADEHDAAIEAYLAVIAELDNVGEGTQAAISVNNLAYHYAMLDRRDEAIDALRESVERRRVLAKQPYLLRAYFNLGYWYLEWDRLAEAESAFRVAIQMGRVWQEPGELGKSLLYLARCVARADQADRAILAYTEAIPNLRAADQDALVTEATNELASLSSVPGGAR